MAISRTYLELQRAIADELGDRQDLMTPLSDTGLTLSPIQNAIQSAVSKWEREQFYFNETYSVGAFNTVIGQEFYTTAATTIIATSPDLLKLHVTVSNNRYPINVRTWQYIDDISSNPQIVGQPVDYAYMAEQIRFYPIPDGVYPVTISGTQRIANLSADGDTNVWTQDAYDLIRSEAKLILAQELIHDDALAARCRMAIYGNPAIPKERGYLSALKGESMRRAKAKIRPSYF